jgi:transposase
VKELIMEVLYPRCAGLDVHKDNVVACVRLQQGPVAATEVKTFGTTTNGLITLSEWLAGNNVTHVAMEATGVYWKPVWHILDESFTLILANAAHIKNVPGRKTDVNDSMWIAGLLAHGLIRASMVPPTAIQDMRGLMRTRKQLVRERAQHIQRIQKTLEDANVKLSSVVTDVVGVSGMAILKAIALGETDPLKLLALASSRLHASRKSVEEALRGRIRPTHRFLLQTHIQLLESLNASVAEIDREVDALLDPFRLAVERLTTMPGVSDTVARVIVSEIGVDMSRFPTAGHLISWAGLCPRNDESAGKRRSTRILHGAPWLKTTLVQAAWAASRCKEGYLRTQFLRIKSRRGPKKAIIAVAASMLTAAYHMLKKGEAYQDLGKNHFDQFDKQRTTVRLVRKLVDMGYTVNLTEGAEGQSQTHVQPQAEAA